MIVNRANLQTLGVGFNTAFKNGLLATAASQWERVATRVPSITGENEYGWMGNLPGVREWIGDRQVQNISTSGYRIRNKDYELTLGVERNHIEDDNIGIYGPLFQQMGASVGSQYDLSAYGLLKAGWTTPCYDGQYFFDTDHPVIGADGAMTMVANTDGGGGAPWFLIDASPARVLKPIILQVRKDWQFISKDKIDDDNVFNQKRFIYGADGRYNVGYGFWQFAWGSKQALNATNYATARAALAGMKGDYGRPLGLQGTLLVVPPSLESAGRKLLNSEYGAGGETNEWKGTAELLVCPWLA